MRHDMCERQMVLENQESVCLLGAEFLSTHRCHPYSGSSGDDSCDSADSTHAIEAALFTDVYQRTGRLDHVIQLMGYHPKYLEAFLRLHYKLFSEDGPLPLADRHYIAIMAASRHGCSYLAQAHIREFSLCGGPLAWLRGLDACPKKLQTLDQLNAVMAHQPWILNTEHFKTLLSGEASVRWSQSELMQAVVIMAHIHALCSFVFGLGVTPELDEPQALSFSGCEDIQSADIEINTRNADTDIDTETDPTRSPLDIPSLVRYMRHVTELPDDGGEDQIQQFDSARNDGNTDTTPLADTGCELYDSTLSRFVLDANFTYSELDASKEESNSALDTAKEESNSALLTQDCSWDGEGYIICDDLYPGMGNCLDAKFRITESLTYNRIGDVLNVDTTAFRQALLNFTHCVFGIRHDDYNYSKMNLLLKKPLKSYAKTVVCFPERLTPSDHEAFIPGLKFSEKVHIHLMLLESRLKAELLYALKQLAALRR